MPNKLTFKDIVRDKDGFLRGPFGGALKKEIFVKKDRETYKVYEQGVVLNKDESIGDYYISKDYFDSSMYRFETKEKDFLVSCSGVNYGAIYQLRKGAEKGVINQALLRIRLNNELVSDSFFKYYFETYLVKKIIGGTGDSTIPNFPPMNVIKSIAIEIPDLAAQIKIAAVLSSLDDKIELNNKINAELEAMAKTLYDYWFVQFDFPDKKGKPYKSSGGKMVWSEELKRNVPNEKGWSVGSLLDIANYTNGLPCQKFRPTGAEFLKVIKIKEMHEGFSENSECVTPDIPIKAIVNNGDVLFSWSASLEVQIWTGGKGALNQHIFKVTSQKFPKSFYYYSLVNYLQHFKMMADNRKTTMGHITQEHLNQSRIAIPPVELTFQLEKIISPFLQMKCSNDIENQKLGELRDWLLPMLMNGQVRVGKIDDQEEEVLSIAAESETGYGKIVQLAIPKNNAGFAKQALAGKIVSLFKADKNFTHIKFQKLQFLAEHIAEADLNLNYYFQTAGPYDNRFMHTIADNFRKSKWYNEKNYKFLPLEKEKEIDKYYAEYFTPVSSQLTSLFKLLSKATVGETEIIATVYAVWNNRLILKQPIKEALLIEDFYNWSDRKHQYNKKQVLDAVEWIKKNGFTPKGFGKEIKRAKSK